MARAKETLVRVVAVRGVRLVGRGYGIGETAEVPELIARRVIASGKAVAEADYVPPKKAAKSSGGKKSSGKKASGSVPASEPEIEPGLDEAGAGDGFGGDPDQGGE